ncbi:MAG: sensor domain-containing phosphodiesterase [Desulfovibrio sp.]|nr:sensor domain-containing phosphodiesterase [Desulfovibrio sp.]
MNGLPTPSRSLSHTADAQDPQTLVFIWNNERTVFLAQDLARQFAGHYDQRQPLLVWSGDNVVHPDDKSCLAHCLRRLQSGIPYLEASFRLRRRSGGYATCDCTFTLTQGKTGQHIGTLRVHKSLSEHCDPLTGVLSVRAFFAATDRLLQHSDRQYCLLRFSVCALRNINQSQGFAAGDHLLRLIARLLRRSLFHDSECLGRMDGDDFAVCLLGEPKRALHFARKLSQLFENKDKRRHADLYFGICAAKGHQTPAHILYDRASSALKSVKGSDVRNVAFYDEQLKQVDKDRDYITSHMAEALKQGEFKLYLQPKVHMPTGRVVGAEALARWLHPEDGMIMPDRFVPLFESNGFVLKLDAYIWEETAKTLRRWIDKGYKPIPVSVNVSRLHFGNTDLVHTFVALTDKYHLPRHLLELEVTETAFIPGEHDLLHKMQRLRQAGFALSMDDFGIGYSSLNSLRNLPFTAVKLDRVFVQGESASNRGRIVAKSTIALARELGLNIVAEGVENEEQAQFLLDNGCQIAQGFYYARPMDATIFEECTLSPHKPDMDRYSALTSLGEVPMLLKTCEV